MHHRVALVGKGIDKFGIFKWQNKGSKRSFTQAWWDGDLIKHYKV